MHAHGMTYRQVRELLETPQDVMDYAAVIAHVSAGRAREMSS